MSNYPSTPSYGGNYGARDQTNPTYLPPTYPNQYLQGDDGRASQGQMGADYDASMSAYDYNRAVPTFSASAVAAGVPPLPIFQGWNQEAVPLPPYTTPQNTSQYTGYGNDYQANAPYYQQPMVQQPYHHHTGVAKPFEQNDLSEGEFEDVAGSTNTPPVGYGSTSYRANDGVGYMDIAHRAISRAQDYNPQQSGYQGKFICS